ncbi:glycosyltransferase family 4 protein [Gaetbulibacter sp. M240]|uniref:glycosyltransferase family 4 protein n=1 Tax=Gaetbulibacter sp. M240 TaxID=3126511 RepID=UPI00374F4678
MKPKLIRITTVPLSLSGLLEGQLQFMSKYFQVLAVSSPGSNDDLEAIQQKEGVPTYPIHMTRKITPIQDLIALKQLYTLFKKEKPFIVHSHTPKAGTLGMLAAKLAGVPHRLHTIAGLPLVEATGLKRILLNTVEKITYACATKIYPNAHGLTEIILKHKFTSKDKLKVIANGSSNGINTAHFSPEKVSDEEKQRLKDVFRFSGSDTIFVFVGRLVADKGINELIVAFDKISKENINAKLLLVGDFETELDPLKEETLNIMKNNPNILNTGWVTDVRPYFSIADILIFPSYREGFPNVVMQAGAMGLPSIVTDINGCNEIIVEGENGTIIPTKDSEAIYHKMAQLLKGELKFESALCRDMITSRYERQVVWDALLQEYQQL